MRLKCNIIYLYKSMRLSPISLDSALIELYINDFNNWYNSHKLFDEFPKYLTIYWHELTSLLNIFISITSYREWVKDSNIILNLYETVDSIGTFVDRLHSLRFEILPKSIVVSILIPMLNTDETTLCKILYTQPHGIVIDNRQLVKQLLLDLFSELFLQWNYDKELESYIIPSQVVQHIDTFVEEARKKDIVVTCTKTTSVEKKHSLRIYVYCNGILLNTLNTWDYDSIKSTIAILLLMRRRVTTPQDSRVHIDNALVDILKAIANYSVSPTYNVVPLHPVLSKVLSDLITGLYGTKEVLDRDFETIFEFVEGTIERLNNNHVPLPVLDKKLIESVMGNTGVMVKTRDFIPQKKLVIVDKWVNGTDPYLTIRMCIGDKYYNIETNVKDSFYVNMKQLILDYVLCHDDEVQLQYMDALDELSDTITEMGYNAIHDVNKYEKIKDRPLSSKISLLSHPRGTTINAGMGYTIRLIAKDIATEYLSYIDTIKIKSTDKKVVRFKGTYNPSSDGSGRGLSVILHGEIDGSSKYIDTSKKSSIWNALKLMVNVYIEASDTDSKERALKTIQDFHNTLTLIPSDTDEYRSVTKEPLYSTIVQMVQWDIFNDSSYRNNILKDIATRFEEYLKYVTDKEYFFYAQPIFKKY